VDEEQTGGGLPDPRTGDLDAVLAAAERGEYDNGAVTAEPEAARQAEPSPDQPQETPGATAPEPVAETQQAPPDARAQAKPDEDWQRKYHSVAGNNAQLQAQLRQQQAQLAEAQRQFQQFQQQAQRQAAMAQEEAQIRASVPAELADEAVREFRERKQSEQEREDLKAGANAYHQYLQAEHAKVEAAKVDLFRASLPQVLDPLARYVAQQIGAPEESLVELTKSEAMNEVLQYVGRPPEPGTTLAQRDADFLAAMMAAMGQVEAKRDAGRKRQNAAQAVAAGTFRSEPDGSGRGSGLSERDRIKSMSDKDFDAMLDRLRQQAGG
jgi:hypothetical protein